MNGDTIIEKNKAGQFVEKPRPDWAADPKLMLTKEKAEAFSRTQLVAHPRMKFVGEHFEVDVVLPGEADVIFHFFLHKKQDDFDTFLAEVVDNHFGSTDGFSVAYTPEVDSWGLKAEGLRKRPLYSIKSYVESFLQLVDDALGFLQAKNASGPRQSRKV